MKERKRFNCRLKWLKDEMEITRLIPDTPDLDREITIEDLRDKAKEESEELARLEL